MTESPAARPGTRDYLCVDAFIGTLVDARALKSAFELRVIDYLRDRSPMRPSELEKALRLDAAGLRLLLGLLLANRVLEQDGDAVGLSPRFLEALRYRDLLEAKIDLADHVVPDLIDLFTASINDPDRFMRSARIFKLFDYGRSVDRTPENREHAMRWMRFTTILTRYEARACLRHHHFGRYARMLDIGGNSGEFALQICREHPSLRATVIDLPVVCAIGREHVGPQPEAGRIEFVGGDALEGALPGDYDLVTFKSMLHDWPEPETARLIGNAARSLRPGGTILIFERGPIDPGEGTSSYAMIPMLLFFRSFRSPTVYGEQLSKAGFVDINIRRIDLEMPFSLVTATKGRDGGGS